MRIRFRLLKMSGIGSATLSIKVLCKRSCSCLLIEMFYTVNSEGLLCRSYCKDCGSKNIGDLTLLTHSCSQERLEYIFRFPVMLIIITIVLDSKRQCYKIYLSGCFHRSVSLQSLIAFCHIVFFAEIFEFVELFTGVSKVCSLQINGKLINVPHVKRILNFFNNWWGQKGLF